MSDYLLELRFGVRRLGAPLLVPPQEVGQWPLRNFRSVYAYAAEDMKGRGVKDMEGVRLYSDQLFVDIDKTQEEVDKFKEFLISSGVKFELWHTGRRGGHFVIDIEPMVGTDIHISQAAWVREALGDSADMTLYKPTGQWRLPGTVHEKHPGHIKHLVFKNPGKKLFIPASTIKLTIKSSETLPLETKADWLSNMTLIRGEGQRSLHIYILCKSCMACGIELEEAQDCVSWWNERFCTPPHDDAYVRNKVEAIYYQLARSYG